VSVASKVLWLSVLGVSLPLIAGCRDNSPPTPRVPPPQAGYDTAERTYEPNKPMPPADVDPTMAPRPFDDPPLLIDTPPEAKRFVEAYRQVGRPRIVVFVNRTLTGDLQPTSEDRATETVERTKRATTGVEVETRDYSASSNRRSSRSNENVDKFKSQGPGEYTETTVKYLHPGEYDELQARNIDYNMMETLLADWMSCDNQVTIMSPATVRRRLTEAQVKDLEAGKAPLSDIARQLDADILVQLQARPTKQTQYGLELRLVGDAINLRGGESLARGSVDMMPPLDKPQTNKYTRFMARKLMDGMSSTWSGATPAAKADTVPAAPTR
jgi:hypothetical protein